MSNTLTMHNYANKKRVTLNKKSLLLDYRQPEQERQVEANDYTRQLVTSALHLPSSTGVNIIQSSPINTSDKRVIDLPRILKSSIRAPKSAPCSPTKSVQFDKENLENICYFRKAQTPLTISHRKNIFWADSDDDEEEDEEEEEKKEATLVFPNWSNGRLADIIDKRNKVIRIEKGFFTVKDNILHGKVLVRNLDYQKTVTVRYTFDYWETVQNVHAIYQSNYHSNTLYDVFTFKINIQSSSLYFAIHYKVGSQEFWDNNDCKNYEIQFVHNRPTSTTMNKDQQEENQLKKRYDFSQAISKQQQPITIKPTPSIPIDVSSSSSPSSRHHQHNNHSNYSLQSNSNSPLYCHSPLASSPSFMDLNSQSYLDLVNKYCFYSSSPTRSPMSTY
ncbi:hypothetical protein RMCBS344292_08663 [Rhizopus microsporus]|nr:hypothetical protein RMCBS344292_08663 [Rhizopus microsporus]